MKEITISEVDLHKIVNQLEEAIENFNSAINLLEPAMLDDDFALSSNGMQKVVDSISTAKEYLE